MRYFDHQTTVINAAPAYEGALKTVHVRQHHLVGGYPGCYVGTLIFVRSAAVKGSLARYLDGIGCVTVRSTKAGWVVTLRDDAGALFSVNATSEKREATVYAAELVAHLTVGALAPIDAVLALLKGSNVLRTLNPDLAGQLDALKVIQAEQIAIAAATGEHDTMKARLLEGDVEAVVEAQVAKAPAGYRVTRVAGPIETFRGPLEQWAWAREDGRAVGTGYRSEAQAVEVAVRHAAAVSTGPLVNRATDHTLPAGEMLDRCRAKVTLVGDYRRQAEALDEVRERLIALHSAVEGSAAQCLLNAMKLVQAAATEVRAAKNIVIETGA